jgi:PAS domain S-box-containing protein
VTPLKRYGIAILAIGAALAFRAALTPWLGPNFPLATIFTAIAFVVWRCGSGPALLTAIGGWAASGLVFRGGLNYFGGLTFNETIGFLLYLLASLPIIVLGESMRRAQRKLEERHSELSTTNLALANKIEAQSLLAAIVASSEDAIISKTLDGVITSWNRGAEKLFGWRADEAIGQSINLIVPPELRAEEKQILERLRDGERIEQLDLARVCKDGRRVHTLVTISPVHDRHGLIIGVSSTARDITIRKAWEDNLVRSEEAQRLLVGIHDATRGIADPEIVMREIATRVGTHFDAIRCAYGEVEADQSGLLISRGYTKDVPTVAGRYSLDSFGPLLAGELRAGRTAVIDDVRTDPFTDTASARKTYAAMQIVAMVVVPLVRAGRLVAILVMADRKPRQWTEDDARLLEQVAERTLFAIEGARAASALREQRNVMQLAMSTARMGAWTRDLVLDTLWWSPEFAELFGMSADDTNYERSRLFEQVRPEDQVRLPAIIEAALRDGQDYAVEFEFQHARTGEWRWMESRGRAVYGADGRPTKIYGLAMDITERRRAMAALQEADRRKDEFLATLAHELRNPLAPIKSGLHILRTTQDPEQSQTALAIMDRQVGQMVRLVDDLLDVARITTGKVDLRSEPFDLATAIRGAVETTAPEPGQPRASVTVNGPREPVLVDGDCTRLSQVFANLLNNSAKYSEPGQPISISFAREGDQAVIRVRDAGIGIHPEMLPRIFEMFRQADRTGGRSRGGLGIGLSLVKRIVELHHGTVTAHSEGLGRGSEFVVRIPAIDAVQVLARRVPGASETHLHTRRKVLVVDDNEDAAESLAALLSISGHDTRMAHDGNDAVREAEQFQPDVVFLDIGMPTLDGHETAKLIRQQPWGKDMVLVALTGWGQSEDRRRSKDAGFNHHLVKPADPAVVEKLLSSLDSLRAGTRV